MKRFKSLTALACALALVLTAPPPARAAGALTAETSMWDLPFGGGGFSNSCDGSAVTADGSLYVWGQEDTLPNNMSETEAPVRLSGGWRAAGLGWAVRTDGSLYVWKNGSAPAKVMDNVLRVQDGYVLKTDGSLWKVDERNYAEAEQILTGVRQFGFDYWTPKLYVLTGGGDFCQYEPDGSGGETLMSGVAGFSVGLPNLLLKQDGSLYVWGSTPDGESRTPLEDAVKVLDGVVSAEWRTMLAVTADGTLYSLEGDDVLHPVPVRRMDGAAAVGDDLLLKQDGSLWYVFELDGELSFNQLLDGVQLFDGAPGPGPSAGEVRVSGVRIQDGRVTFSVALPAGTDGVLLAAGWRGGRLSDTAAGGGSVSLAGETAMVFFLEKETFIPLAKAIRVTG